MHVLLGEIEREGREGKEEKVRERESKGEER